MTAATLTDRTSADSVPSEVHRSRGLRVYAVRLAVGDGIRKPMPLREFVTLVNATGIVRMETSTVSLIERGIQKLSIAQCRAVAAVDPFQRGAAWIAFGEVYPPSAYPSADGQ